MKLPENLDRLRRLAVLDLWYGPLPRIADDGRPWPGFVGACDAIRAWAEANDFDHDWYCYEDGDVWPNEPECDCCEPYSVVDWRALVCGDGRMGRELIEYL